MKRLTVFTAALAICIYPALALAQDTNLDVGSLLSEVMGYIGSHDWVGLCAVVAAVFYTLLTDRAKFMQSWDSPWRTVIGTVFSGIGMVLGLVQHGTGTAAIAAALLQNTVPTLVAELVSFFHAKNASKGGGTGGINLVEEAKKKASLPPLNPPAAMVGASVLLVLGAIAYGCATAKEIACPALDLADKACPYVIMYLGDGTAVRVPRGRAEALAKQEAALQGLTDGGK